MQKFDKSVLIFGITLFLKFILFDVLWYISTTFVPFSTIESYTTKLIVTLILLLPYAFFKLWKTESIIMFLLDMLLIANLMYFRTYFTAIPLTSYGLSGNLADFTASVTDSFRWYDLLFPLSTVVAIIMHLRTPKAFRLKRPVPVLPYLGALAVVVGIFSITTQVKGGFKSANEQVRQAAYLCSSGASIYTVFGSLCYDYLNQQTQITPEAQKRIEDWLAQKPKHIYPSLQKAMREKKHARNYLLTINKVSTWNQGPIAYSFGTDTILAYHDFELTEAFGTQALTG